MKPLSRRNGILRENLPEEVVLYDKTRDQVHCLNKTAATVWESSDGARTIDDLVRIVEEKTGTSADCDMVLQALAKLEEAGLMEAGSSSVSRVGLPSRREAVGKIAMAGSALVATVVAAAPQAHASLQPHSSDPPPLQISSNPPDPPPKPDPPSTGHEPTGPLPSPIVHTPTNPTPLPTGHLTTTPTPSPIGSAPTAPTTLGKLLGGKTKP